MTLHRGAPDMAASLWIGDLGGEAAQSADGRSLSRPSWSLDDAVWVVVEGNNVLRAIQEPASGQPARIPVDSVAVSSRFPPITDLQLSRDSTRAAMVIGGQVILAGVEQTQAGQYALTYPRRLGFGLGTSVVSLSWRTGDDIVVTRTDAEPSGVVREPRRGELRRVEPRFGDSGVHGRGQPVDGLRRSSPRAGAVFGVGGRRAAGLVGGLGADGARGGAGFARLSG